MADAAGQTPNGRYLAGGQYRPLLASDIGRIHETSLRVLEEVGVAIGDAAAARVFTDAGAHVDDDGRVRIPPELIERALGDAPSRVLLASRDGQRDVILEGSRTYFGTGGAALRTLDLETQECRPSTLADIADAARLVDALENVDFFVRPCIAQDVPHTELGVNEVYAAAANTTRHVMGAAYTPDGARQVIRLGHMLVGGHHLFRKRPILSLIVAWMNSPLTFDPAGTRTLSEAVRRGVPVTLSAAPMAGATAPITLAGTLTQLHAEELAGVAFTQLLRPGAPVIYGGVPSVADLHRVRYIGGAVEFGMMNAAISQLAHYCRLPNYNSAGVTEAKTPDMQAVYEKSFAVLQCALAGSNCIHHAAGMLESLMTLSLEQLVIDNEIIAMAVRAVKGIQVSEDRMGFAAIRENATARNYLAADHTLRYLRGEFLEPTLADRRDRPTWLKLGEDIGAKARRRARELLAAPPREAAAIDPQVDADIHKHFDIVA